MGENTQIFKIKEFQIIYVDTAPQDNFPIYKRGLHIGTSFHRIQCGKNGTKEQL